MDYDFFNLIIIRKCQTRFEGGTKCHLLFSYCVILLFFHYFSSVYNRFFILSVCAWFSGNIAGSCKVMDDTFYTQWNNVVCSLKDNCNIAIHVCLELVWIEKKNQITNIIYLRFYISNLKQDISFLLLPSYNGLFCDQVLGYEINKKGQNEVYTCN